MKLSEPEQEKIDVWVNDFVTIMNGSTFTDNQSYTDTLRGMAQTYIENAYKEGKRHR